MNLTLNKMDIKDDYPDRVKYDNNILLINKNIFLKNKSKYTTENFIEKCKNIHNQEYIEGLLYKYNDSDYVDGLKAKYYASHGSKVNINAVLNNSVILCKNLLHQLLCPMHHKVGF